MTALTDRGRSYPGHRSTASNPSGRPPYQFNWSTKGMADGLYRMFEVLNEGTTQSVDICLSK